MPRRSARFFSSKIFTAASTGQFLLETDIDASDLDRLTKIALEMHQDVVREYRKAFQIVGRRMTSKMKSRVPPEYADVRKGIKFRTKKGRDRLTLTIRSDSERSAELEYGTSYIVPLQPETRTQTRPERKQSTSRDITWEDVWKDFQKWAQSIGKSKEAARIWNKLYGFSPTRRNLARMGSITENSAPTGREPPPIAVPKPPIEAGSQEKIPPTKNVVVVPPRPFFWNTVVEELPPSLEIIRTRVEEAVKRVIAKNQKPIIAK